MKLNINVFGILMIVFIGYICLKIYQESEAFQLKCIISKIDGNEYCVRESSKLELLAYILARCTVKMKKLVEHMIAKYPSRENVKRLKKGFKSGSGHVI